MRREAAAGRSAHRAARDLLEHELAAGQAKRYAGPSAACQRSEQLAAECFAFDAPMVHAALPCTTWCTVPIHYRGACAALWHGCLSFPHASQPPRMCCRLPTNPSTLEDLVSDRDWQRERAEACASGRASGEELPEAWHLAEQAFQAFVRAVGMLQVSPALRVAVSLPSRHDFEPVLPARPDWWQLTCCMRRVLPPSHDQKHRPGRALSVARRVTDM